MNGSIDATITGGVMPYDLSWTGPSFSASTEDISGLFSWNLFFITY